MVVASNNKYSAPTAEEENRSDAIVMIPTSQSPNPAEEQEIDLRQMDEQDLKSLKRSGKSNKIASLTSRREQLIVKEDT
jgi:hypothetical protein